MRLKNKDIIVYQNEFVDKFVLDYKQKEIDLFFGIIFSMQKDSKIIKFDKDDIKRIIKTSNLSSKEFTALITGLAKQAIRYKTKEQIIDDETGEILAEPGDFITINFFDMLIEKKDNLTIKLKEEFKKYFFDIQKDLGFSKHELQDVFKLSSRYAKLLFILLNRWKNFSKVYQCDFQEFKNRMNFPEKITNSEIKRIIDRAKILIEKNTKLKFEYEFIKRGKKVESINFFIQNTLRELIIKARSKDISEMERSVLLLGLKRSGIDIEDIEIIDEELF